MSWRGMAVARSLKSSLVPAHADAQCQHTDLGGVPSSQIERQVGRLERTLPSLALVLPRRVSASSDAGLARTRPNKAKARPTPGQHQATTTPNQATTRLKEAKLGPNHTKTVPNRAKTGQHQAATRPQPRQTTNHTKPGHNRAKPHQTRPKPHQTRPQLGQTTPNQPKRGQNQARTRPNQDKPATKMPKLGQKWATTRPKPGQTLGQAPHQKQGQPVREIRCAFERCSRSQQGVRSTGRRASARARVSHSPSDGILRRSPPSRTESPSGPAEQGLLPMFGQIQVKVLPGSVVQFVFFPLHPSGSVARPGVIVQHVVVLLSVVFRRWRVRPQCAELPQRLRQRTETPAGPSTAPQADAPGAPRALSEPRPVLLHQCDPGQVQRRARRGSGPHSAAGTQDRAQPPRCHTRAAEEGPRGDHRPLARIVAPPTRRQTPERLSRDPRDRTHDGCP